MVFIGQIADWKEFRLSAPCSRTGEGRTLGNADG